VRGRLALALALAASLVAPAAALAQRGTRGEPSAGYVYPAGAAVGTTVEVWVGGQRLGGAHGARVSGGGVHAEVLGRYRPLNNQQRQALRRRLRAMAQREDGNPGTGRTRDTDQGVEIPPLPGVEDLDRLDQRGVAELQRRLFDPRRQENPQIAETVVLRLSVDPDATPGLRELRLLTPQGATNPLRFEVGSLPEVGEREPNDREPAESTLAAPMVVNGQITPGDVDRFRFRFESGTQTVVAAQARRLVPYLADAVPGWFQAVATVYGPDGAELAFDDDFLFHPDPALVFEAPVDGEYTVEIRDALWRGREDFVYRLVVGELPFLSGAFPLGAPAGVRTVVSTFGWNLAPEGVVLDVDAAEAGGRLEVAPLAGARGQQPVVLELDERPALLEHEPASGEDTPQEIELPALIDGRVDQPGDLDRFVLAGRAGDRIVAEVTARRLGSPLDSFLQLVDPDGTVVAGNDDFEDPAEGLLTHHADSRLEHELPRRGRYTLVLGDTQGQGSELHSYRLRIGPPRPGFELRATPSAINVPAGGTTPFTVHVLRRDGFDGEIALELRDAPRGFRLGGGIVPRGAESVRLTLSAPTMRPMEPVLLDLVGRADVDGSEVVRPVKPADDRMQAFLWRFLVPAEEFLARVTQAGGVRTPVRLARDGPWRIPLGGEARIRLVGPVRTLPEGLSLRLEGAPEGFVVGALERAEDGVSFTLRVDRSVVEEGLAGNLVVEIWGDPAALRGRSGARAGGDGVRRGRGERKLGVLPAVPFRVVTR